jgi:hypothetical protein
MNTARFLDPDTIPRLLPITLSQLVGLACGLVGVRLSSWLVPPTDFGRYGVFLTFAPLGMWVVHAGVIKFVSRHWAGATDRGALLRAVIASAWRKTPWLAVAAGLAAGLIAGRGAWVVFPAVFLAAFLLSGGAIAQTALQAARQHWRDLAVAGTGSVTRSLLPPLLYAAAGGSVLALYGGYCLHTLALAAAGAWARHADWRPAGPRPGRLVPVYEGPMFIVLSATGWILASLGRWIMAAFFGADETGYFVLAGNLATLVPSMLGTIILQYHQPGFFAVASDAPEQRRNLAARVDRVALGHAALALAGLGALRLIAPWLIGPLINARYEAALPWLLPAGGFGTATMTGIFYHSLLLAGRRERACVPVDLITAGVLAAGSLAAAAAGTDWFARWMIITPLVPWALTRPLARRHFFRPA